MPRAKKTSRNNTSDASASATAREAPARPPETATAPPVESATVPESVAAPARASSAGRPARQRQLTSMLVPVLVLAVLLTAAGFGYRLFAQRNQGIAGPDKNLINEVSRIAVLPKDEVPSVTTVVDTTKVNQEFLRSARKGDKVLLYFQEGRAVVYRPSTRQIVNMGPLQTPKPRVFLRDGTGSSNLNAVSDKITGSNEFLFASRDVSPIKNYDKSVVVDLTGRRPDVAQRLAKLLGLSVVKLPDGESRPDGDLLVIVGKDNAGIQPTKAAETPTVEPAADQPAANGTTP